VVKWGCPLNSLYRFLAVWLVCHGCFPSSGFAQQIDDGIRAFEKANKSSDDWSRLFNGLSFTATETRRKIDNGKSTGLKARRFQYTQLDRSHWRFDLEDSSIVCDKDFWFIALDSKKATSRYGRLGFDHQAKTSIETSLLVAQNALLGRCTHILEIPIAEFRQLEGLRLVSSEEPQRPESEFRVLWKMDPPESSQRKQSNGALEWITVQDRLYLTRTEWRSGTKLDGPGIIVDVYWNEENGLLLPMRAVENIYGKHLVETVRTELQPTTDATLYSPAAFGLVRPSKPRGSWVYWVGIGSIAFALAAFFRFLKQR
jgi:hypothetical protein